MAGLLVLADENDPEPLNPDEEEVEEEEEDDP